MSQRPGPPFGFMNRSGKIQYFFKTPKSIYVVSLVTGDAVFLKKLKIYKIQTYSPFGIL
jgi:hypothetical protein